MYNLDLRIIRLRDEIRNLINVKTEKIKNIVIRQGRIDFPCDFSEISDGFKPYAQGEEWSDTAFDSYDCIEIAPQKGFAVNIDGNRYINPEPVYLTVPSGISPVLSYKIEKNDDSCITECYHEGAKLSTFYLVKE
jgi:hypothetical protein